MEKYASPLTWKQLTQYFCADAWHRLHETKRLRLVLQKPQPWKNKQSKHHQLNTVSCLICYPEVESFDHWCRNLATTKNGQSQGHMDLLMPHFYNLFQRVPRLYIDSFMWGFFESMRIMKLKCMSHALLRLTHMK